jgi:hypothetical protein
MSELLDRLQSANPNIADQMREWQSSRAGSGEDATDWGAFRQHVIDLGGEDPGDEAPEEFTAGAS